VDNAASFAKAAARVTVQREEGGRRVAIAVEDDGPGMPPEHIGRVFDRFFTYRPGEERGRHTGLGLSLALALARAESGEIEASNRSGGGARFTLWLPLVAL
jgi:two-component system sensor histidine kinase ChvG